MSVTQVDTNKYRIFISDGTNLDGSRRRFSKTITTDLKGRDLKRFLLEEEFSFEDEIKKKSVNYNNMAENTFTQFSDWWLDYRDFTAQTRESYEYNLKFKNNHIGDKVLFKLSNLFCSLLFLLLVLLSFFFFVGSTNL